MVRVLEILSVEYLPSAVGVYNFLAKTETKLFGTVDLYLNSEWILYLESTHPH